MSISISPAITTTPALDSLFPIYWDDLTDEQKQDGVSISAKVPSGTLTGGVIFTATPTSDWYMIDLKTGEPTVGEKGMPIHTSATPLAGKVTGDYVCTDRPDAPEEAKSFLLNILIKEE